MIRSFLAADVPPALRESIVCASEKLRSSATDVKWLKPEAIHLTLKFLGNIEEEQIEPIVAAISRVIANQEPLVLKAEGIGVFPNLKRPRVIWVGLVGDTERLITIQTKIELSLSDLGFPAEKRPFSPHLTLGRIRSDKRITDLVRNIQELEGITFAPFTVTELVLYRSILQRDGAIYTPLRRLPFMS